MAFQSCILELPIFSFGKVILRDRCSTSYDLASLFRGRGNTLDRWNGKIAKRIGTEPSGFPFPKEVSHSCFFFDVVNLKMKSHRIASFLTLSSSKIEDVSQNCCVFELSSSKTEEVSQNSFVFKLADCN